MRIRRNRPDSLGKSVQFIYRDHPTLAEKLAFGVARKKDTFNFLIHEIRNELSTGGHMGKVEECAKELGKMISADPRLGHFLDIDFLTFLIPLLECQKYPNIQAHIAKIFSTVVTFVQERKDIVVLMDDILSIVLKLICSRVYMVQKEVLWLLRNLVFAMPSCRVEEVVSIIAPLIITESVSFNVLNPASETLLVACELHSKLLDEKLMLAVPALIKLVESNVLMLLTSGCWGLALLCDGREEMIVEDKYLGRLITRLVKVMHSIDRTMIVSSLHAMGSIVRWSSDDVIETIIKEDGALLILAVLLDEDDMYIVKQTCWILSNITARKQKHIRAVIDGVTDGNLIGSLVNVVLNCELYEVTTEAIWAISNAMCGVGIDQIGCLRKSCSQIVWGRILVQFSAYRLFVLVTLEGLVNIKMAKVTCSGQPINIIKMLEIFNIIKMHDDDHVGPAASSIKKSDFTCRLIFEFEGSLGHIMLTYFGLNNFFNVETCV